MTLISNLIYTILSYMTLKKTANKASKSNRNEEFLLKIGQRLQEILDKQSITHEIFYADTSINAHRIIVGKVNMTMSTFSRICDYLKVNPEEFFRKL